MKQELTSVVTAATGICFRLKLPASIKKSRERERESKRESKKGGQGRGRKRARQKLWWRERKRERERGRKARHMGCKRKLFSSLCGLLVYPFKAAEAILKALKQDREKKKRFTYRVRQDNVIIKTNQVWERGAVS